MTHVAGRTVLVTGAASGIGRQLSTALARRGARVVLWDVDAGGLDEAVREVRASGASAFGYVCDVGDASAVRAAAQRVRTEVGDVDVLVNNAGIVSGRLLLDLTEEQIRRTYAVNTLAHYWTTRAFLPAMVERNAGHVVTIASAAGLAGVPRQCDYAGSKHAAVGFADALRAELRQVAPGVRTTLVCPYYIDTGMFAGVRTRFSPLLPILRPDDVTARIARAIENDQARVLLPPIVNLMPLVSALPTRLGDAVLGVLGVNHSMDTFVGRKDS